MLTCCPQVVVQHHHCQHAQRVEDDTQRTEQRRHPLQGWRQGVRARERVLVHQLLLPLPSSARPLSERLRG